MIHTVLGHCDDLCLLRKELPPWFLERQNITRRRPGKGARTRAYVLSSTIVSGSQARVANIQGDSKFWARPFILFVNELKFEDLCPFMRLTNCCVYLGPKELFQLHFG